MQFKKKILSAVLCASFHGGIISMDTEPYLYVNLPHIFVFMRTIDHPTGKNQNISLTSTWLLEQRKNNIVQFEKLKKISHDYETEAALWEKWVNNLKKSVEEYTKSVQEYTEDDPKQLGFGAILIKTASTLEPNTSQEVLADKISKDVDALNA